LLSRQSTSDNNLASSSGNSLRTVAEDPENQNSISPSVKQIIQQILEEESEDKDTQDVQNVTPNIQQSEQIPNVSCEALPLAVAGRTGNEICLSNDIVHFAVCGLNNFRLLD
jgi:hypothetical protein